MVDALENASGAGTPWPRQDRIRVVEAQQPVGIRPEEIEVLLAGVPDLRPVLADSEPEELADLLDAFDVEVAYDKQNRALRLAATITAELVSPQETLQPPLGGRRIVT